MRSPLGALADMLAFKRDAAAFFRAHDPYATGDLELDLGLRRVRVISDARVAREVLTHPAFERGARPYGPLGTFAGQGSLRWLIGPTLPTLDGDAGAERRARVRPMYVEVARALRQTPLPELDWSGVSPGPLDLHALVSASVFELVCVAMFGRAYPEMAYEITRTIDSATDALDLTSKSLRPYAVRFGAPARAIRSSRAALRAFAGRVLDDLGALTDRSGVPMRGVLGPGWTREDAIDETVTTLVAGLETTTITCCWCITELLRQPEIMNDLNMMNDTREARIDRVIKETLRLYPAFWTMVRVAREDVTLEECGARFGAGDVLFVSPLFVHRNPAYWPDPERFDPSRHVDRERVEIGDYMPFGFGARACIGAQLSTLIARRVVEAACALGPMRFVEGEPDGPDPDPKIIVLKSRTGFHVEVGAEGGLEPIGGERERVLG